MKIFLLLKKIVLSALCLPQIAICTNACVNIHDTDPVNIDPVNRLKKLVNGCEWLDSYSKDLLNVTPPFQPFCEKAITYVKSLCQPQSEINVERAKTEAIKFFSKYLAKMPDFLDISKDVINNGHYIYVNSDHWAHILTSRLQVVISEDDNWSSNVEEIIQLLTEGKTKDDIIKRCMPFLNMDNPLDAEATCRAGEFIDEVKHKYMDFSNVAKNFEITVSYSNQKTLLINAIHATGYALDYAYRIKHGKYLKTVTTDHNAISVFFETVAKKDFESNGYDVLRLLAPYGAMMGFDLIQRANNRLIGTISDITTLEQIRQEIEHDWQSPSAKLIQLDIGNGEILKFVQWIRSGGSLQFSLYDYLNQMVRAKILLANEKDLINKMPAIMEHLVMERPSPLTGNDYLQLYDSIVI